MRKLALSVLGLLCITTAVHANVLWRGDYETGDVAQWDRIDGLASRLTVQQSVVHQGNYALRVELHQGDVSSSGTRNEVVEANPAHYESEGNDRWYAWSTLFPSDYPSNNTWQVFTQWHHTGCCGSPPVEFDVLGERIQLAHDGGTVLWSTPLVRGVWHDFVVHVFWSSSGGFVELYYDGQKVLGKTSVQTLYPGEQAYMKQGLYWNANISSVGVLYHDGMTSGTTLADVAPQLANPPVPPPAPTPDAGTPDLPDAGAPPSDAGTPPDPAPAPVPDPQAAAPETPEAGTVQKSGFVGFPDGGCSHTSGSSLAVLGLVALGFFAARRRRS
jgi:MYXO-CTERM domain-containing protein